MRLNPLKVGLAAAAVAFLMGLTDLLFQPTFRVTLGGVVIPLWILVAIYAALQFYLWNSTRQGMHLTDDEVARWGATLERATPEIVRGIEQRRPVKDIAGDVQEHHGIPVDVTLRYIIALGQVPGAESGEAS